MSSLWNLIEGPDGERLFQAAEEPISKGWKLLVQTSNPEYLIMPTPRLLSRLEFRRRFTMAERVAIDSLPDNPALAAEVRATARTMLTDLAMAQEINLDDADVVTGVGLMVNIGILTAERAREILG